MRAPRGLSAEEAAAWAQVAATVRPIDPRLKVAAPVRRAEEAVPMASPPPAPPKPVVKGPGPARPASPGSGLDSHWDRRFRAGSIEPDFTLDLHGHTLDQAHGRLNDGLAQAKAMSARVVLLIAGKPRPADPADRGSQRGAIRAKLLDWLAAGPHRGDVSAIRKAHRRHGGEGALYLVLKRRG